MVVVEQVRVCRVDQAIAVIVQAVALLIGRLAGDALVGLPIDAPGHAPLAHSPTAGPDPGVDVETRGGPASAAGVLEGLLALGVTGEGRGARTLDGAQLGLGLTTAAAVARGQVRGHTVPLPAGAPLPAPEVARAAQRATLRVRVLPGGDGGAGTVP